MKRVISKIFFIGVLTSSVFLVNCGLNDLDKGLTFQEQLDIDVDLIDSHLLENDINAEVHETGIRYVHDQIGDGEAAALGDLVGIKYKGTLLDGTFFGEDSLGISLQLSNPTIAVLQLIIPLMNVGGRMTIYAPSGYCFGRNAVGNAPANSILIFVVELLAVIDGVEDQQIFDESVIDEFLFERDLTAEMDPSGIRYITLLEGTGDSPTVTDAVLVKYKGTFLNGNVFDQNTSGVQFSLSELIQAWKIMLPTMKEGGKIEIYAPSKYCYGSAGTSSIPPNTNLVFEVELVSIP